MKRPSLQFSVPCLEVVEDEKGPPSFSRIFYELPFPEFPFKFPGRGFFIANGWCNGQGNFAQEMKILNPDKKSALIGTGKQPFDLKELETPFMAINLFQDVMFPQPGTYWIQIYLSDELALEYPLVVRKAEGPAAAKQPAAKAEKPPQAKKSPEKSSGMGAQMGNIAPGPKKR
ncbi:MAG: hypothetical protein RDV48_26925 [Candidatus Eremiobacteraeota bacterium]|nr:hypothetical protein [Candidatus Eremiobacteraeota bacterium]